MFRFCLAKVSFFTSRVSRDSNLIFRLPGGLKHISSGHQTVWGVNRNDEIWTMTNVYFDVFGQIQFKWKKISGGLKNVSTV